MLLEHVLEFTSQSLHVFLDQTCPERGCKPALRDGRLETRGRRAHRGPASGRFAGRIHVNLAISIADEADELTLVRHATAGDAGTLGLRAMGHDSSDASFSCTPQ